MKPDLCRNGIVARLSCLVLFGVFAHANGALESPSVFVIEAGLVTKHFPSLGAPPDHIQESHVTFQSSNGWWEVTARYPHSQIPKFNIQDCMKIPGGTRQFVDLENHTNAGGVPGVMVCPMPFPCPAHDKMFVPWLALSANPELPILDKSRMHRFLMLPQCNSDLQNSSSNVGYYHLSYLPGGLFISELSITNNGFYLDHYTLDGIQWQDDNYRYAPPFDNGFLNFKYHVLETTNVHGFQFPRVSVLELYGGRPKAKTSSATFLVVSTELSVEEISVQLTSANPLRK